MAQQFPCQQCGADLEFAPGSLNQACPYCGHENPIPQSDEDIHELDYEAVLADMENAEEITEQVVARCDGCGAESSMDPNITSDDCPFCGSPMVANGGSNKQIKPKSLLPFKVTKDEATQSFTDWIQGLWFAPNKLKQFTKRHQGLNGMYVPYWTYDCNSTSYYTGERGEHYYVTETYTTQENGQTVTKTRQVRRTRWHRCRGVVWNDFDDILVLASNSLPQKYIEALEPWDLVNLVPYGDEYLAGFRTESYQVELGPGFVKAQEIMDDSIRDTIRHDIGGDEQRINTVKSQYDNVTFKHILLPVWISAYRYQEQVYRFLINARTGEVQGERPYSWIKITLAVITGLAVAGTIFALASR